MEKTNDILRMKEYLRNMQACIADLIEQMQLLSSELDDMLVEETTGKRFMADDDYEHKPLEEMGIHVDEPSVSISHSETNTFSQCPAPAPEDIEPRVEQPLPLPPEPPEPPKKQGILSRIRKDPKVDIEKENREKMLKELEAQMEELKKKR